MPSFAKSATQYTTFEKRYDADGGVWVQVQAHGNLTALTPYKVIVNEFGYLTAAIADDTTRYYVGVPQAAVASGAVAWIQIGGYVAGVVTPSLSGGVGEALSITNGVITDDAADYTGVSNQFAVFAVASTSSTTQSVILIPEMAIGT